MSADKKTALTMIMLCATAFGLILSACTHIKNDNSGPLNRQESGRIAAIERRGASGDLTSMEENIEKEAVTPRHSFKF